MQRSRFPTLTQYAAALALALPACGGTHAAELGEAIARSFIGQPLVADIELTALAPDEIGRLQVRLATPDVYRGANIVMNPALQSLTVTEVRRDQRQYLRVSTARRIDAQYVHLFLELSAGERSMVRAATVWLTPDPAPAPPPAAAVPAPAPVAVRRSAPAPQAQQEHGQERAAAPDPLLLARQAPPVSLPRRQSEPKMCGPHGAAGDQARACLALDRRNAVLSRKLVELEGKVKVLQKELAHNPGEAPKAEPPAPVKALAPVKPKPLKRAPALIKKESESGAWPVMLLAGGAALLLLTVGLTVYAFRRRKKDKAPSAPSKYWVLLRHPFRRKQAAEAAPPAPAAEGSYTPVAEAAIE